MSIHFHKLAVKDLQRETADCVSVLLDVPDTLQEAFRFKQGQSLTMRTFLDNEEVRRTYSLCSSPTEREWRVAIKKVDGGLFSTFANTALRKGDILEVMPPVGNFYTELSPANQKNYLAFAAGSGITPVLSIIKTTLKTEPKSRFTLVYGNRDRASVIFLEELQGLKNHYMDRLNLVHILSRERVESAIHFGRIDEEKARALEKLIDYLSMDEIFICGPENMIFTLRDFLLGLGIEKKKIHFELFTTPGETKKTVTEKKEASAQGPKSTISIRLDGRFFEMHLAKGDDTPILDAALKQGADLPFACKGGVCCTCKARLLEGEVSMDVHWGLEDEEVEQGYILTCQSHPLSEKLVIDFDIK